MSARPILAGDAATKPERAALPLGAAPCLAVDQLWEHFAEQGSRALAAGQYEPSLTHWRVAATYARSFADDDPRRAASLAGEAAAGLASGRLDPIAAEREARRAAEAWRLTERWIDGMTLELSGRSSLFHFRLERKHGDAYQNLIRADCRRLAEAGAAACLLNLATALHDRKPEEAAALYRRAIATRKAGLGARDLACLVAMENLQCLAGATGDTLASDIPLTNEIAALIKREPIAPFDRWRTERPAKMTDRRRLLAAVYLSPVLGLNR